MSNVFSRLHNDIKNETSTRIELVGFVVTLFAFLSHICFLVLFYFLQVKPMFYFNIFSVLLFGILFFTFKKQPSYLPQYIISAIEVIVHQVFADYFLGVQSSFHYYIILIALIACLELGKHIGWSLFFSILCAASFLAIEIGMADLTPVYSLTALGVKIIKTSNIALTLIVIVIIEYVFTVTVSKAEKETEVQYDRAQKLLNNILPTHIVNKLKSDDNTEIIADSYNSAVVFFLDIVDFTKYSTHLEAKAIVTILNSFFSMFDGIVDEYHVEKIKTSGDSYMAATGIPYDDEKRFENMANFALRAQSLVLQFNKEHHSNFEVRMGIHSGPVAAGVIGKKKFVYDLWGSTVNFAAQIEATSIPGKIQVSKEFYNQVKDKFVFAQRAPIPIKNFGMHTNYYLLGAKK
ncbi:MAG: adenylate/guanylate cyclase domain-containing protein [Treponema sp.]